MAARRSERHGRRPATGHTLGLTLDRAPGAPPLYRQICESVHAAMLSGAVGAGTRLPPERELAVALGVNRTTVMHAYQELVADGILEARPGRGTLVCEPLERTAGRQAGTPDFLPEAAWLLSLAPLGHGNLGPDPGLLRDITALSGQKDVISFAGGAPGADLLPLAALQQALETGLRCLGPQALSYGPVEGLPDARSAFIERLRHRGVRVERDELMVVSGATQGISLVAQALVEPGDEVVVEAPTFIGVLQTFAAAGARLVGIPMDERGMRVDMLAAVLARRRVRLIVVQPTLHNPTNWSLAQERRERLLTLARRYGVPVLEDDAYGELWHDADGPPPLKSLDRTGMVLHLGTLSKTVAPGLRVGWIAGSAPVIARLTLAKQFADLHSNALAQVALTEFVSSGAFERHLALVRAAYTERREAMLGALRTVPGVQAPSTSEGGFYVWCRLPPGVQARVLAAAAARIGVAVLAGEAFYPHDARGIIDGRERLRLSCASHPPEVIAEGVRRLRMLIQDPAMYRQSVSEHAALPVV